MLDQSEKRNDRFSIEIVAQLVKRVLPRKFDRYFLETVYIYIYICAIIFQVTSESLCYFSSTEAGRVERRIRVFGKVSRCEEIRGTPRSDGWRLKVR